ncbi:MAG: STAS domain-containing protein [Terriglobales bacterium]
MAFRIQTRNVDDATVLALIGRLTIGDAVSSLQECFNKHIAAGDRNIVLDMRQLDYVDSSGLGAIVTSLTSARNQGGTLRLANVPQRIQNLLDVSSLYMIFQIIELAEPSGTDATKTKP